MLRDRDERGAKERSVDRGLACCPLPIVELDLDGRPPMFGIEQHGYVQALSAESDLPTDLGAGRGQESAELYLRIQLGHDPMISLRLLVTSRRDRVRSRR